MLSSLLVDECGVPGSGVANNANSTTNNNTRCNNMNPLLPPTITLPSSDQHDMICLRSDGEESVCYTNQPKLYNILMAFDPSNYEGTKVERKKQEKKNLVDHEVNEKWKKWNKMIPGRFVHCWMNIETEIEIDVFGHEDDDYGSYYYEEEEVLYTAIVLTEPQMQVDGTYLGIQLWDEDEDDDEDESDDDSSSKQYKWVNIDWCLPDSDQYVEQLLQSPSLPNLNYVVENNNPIHHRAFSKTSLLSTDGIIKNEEESIGSSNEDDDQIMTLFTYSDIFYVEESPQQQMDDGNDSSLDILDQYEIDRHPLPGHLGIDLSNYNYKIKFHPSIYDDEVQNLDNKYRLYELYSTSQIASQVFPTTYGSVYEAFEATALEDDQVFYIKSCCEARGLDIGLFHLSDLHRILYENHNLIEAELSKEDDVDNIRLLKKFLNNGNDNDGGSKGSKEDYDYDYDYDYGGGNEKDDDKDGGGGGGWIEGDYVVQKAVHDLYTLDYGPLRNRRFDIRFYVIIAHGKVYMHANGHMKWVIGNFEFDPNDTTLSRQVSNIAVYGGGDTARWVFPFEVNGNTSWKDRRRRPSTTSSSSSKTKTKTKFDPYGWRDAISHALDKAADAVFERARLVTQEDPNTYFFMGGDAVIRKNGEASIIEFNVWPDVDKYGRFENCLGNDKSGNCRRMVMLENDDYGMDEEGIDDGNNDDDDKGKNQDEQKDDDKEEEPPGYYVTDLNIITDIASSEGLARVMRDMVLLVTGTPAESILGLREIGSQYIEGEMPKPKRIKAKGYDAVDEEETF